RTDRLRPRRPGRPQPPDDRARVAIPLLHQRARGRIRAPAARRRAAVGRRHVGARRPRTARRLRAPRRRARAARRDARARAPPELRARARRLVRARTPRRRAALRGGSLRRLAGSVPGVLGAAALFVTAVVTTWVGLRA